MIRYRLAARAVMALTVAAFLLAGRFVPASAVQVPPDGSDVVLVLDFSASILNDAANRERFADALDRIADRVDATSSDLVAGDTTVTLVQFATRAADYPGCVDLGLLDSPAVVARFADCLREAALAYRKGLDAALTTKIGVDTNYVAAMTVAARHLPADAVRPAIILFTDGKHDVQGVPVGQVLPARDRLFGARSPFALLPVGMGLSPAERPALESGLVNLRLIKDMPACGSGSQIEWPQVVFDSPADAGNAVAVALQNVTCTFTVAPTPTPTRSRRRRRSRRRARLAPSSSHQVMAPSASPGSLRSRRWRRSSTTGSAVDRAKANGRNRARAHRSRPPPSSKDSPMASHTSARSWSLTRPGRGPGPPHRPSPHRSGALRPPGSPLCKR